MPKNAEIGDSCPLEAFAACYYSALLGMSPVKGPLSPVAEEQGAVSTCHIPHATSALKAGHAGERCIKLISINYLFLV